jgi:hypothetical protein
MTDQEYQSGEEKQQAPQDIVQPTKSLDKSRRSFAKSGLVVSGVLLTLSSRPVLGQSVCKSPSGFESGNLSFHGTPITCSGRTPGFWMNHTDWPSPYKAYTTTQTVNKGVVTTTTNPGTYFKEYFHCIGNGAKFGSLTIMQVIQLTGQDDKTQIGAHSVAALLNARSGLTPVLTEAQVKNIFNEYDSKGYFEPTAGIKWNAEDIVTYLKTTMPL